MDKIFSAEPGQRPGKSKQNSRPANGALIRALREKRGFTQIDLGRLSGYSERLIRKAESGGSIRLETFQNLAVALSNSSELISFSDLIAVHSVTESGVTENTPQEPTGNANSMVKEATDLQVSHSA